MSEAPAIIKTRIASVWLDNDGIIRSVLVPHAEVTLEGAEETAAAYQQVSQGIPRPLLTDSRLVKSVDRPSRIYGTSDAVASVVSALAVLIASPVSRIVGNFFLRVNKPPYPMRLFTSEEEAIEWLKGFIE